MNFLHIEQKIHRPGTQFVHGEISAENPDKKSQPSDLFRGIFGYPVSIRQSRSLSAPSLFVGPDPAVLPRYSLVPIRQCSRAIRQYRSRSAPASHAP